MLGNRHLKAEAVWHNHSRRAIKNKDHPSFAVHHPNFRGEPWRYTPRPGTSPVALLYFHVGKCAGGSVVNWLERQNPRFTMKLAYGMAPLFLGLFPAHFPTHARRWGTSRPDWRNESIFVEFHAWAEGFYLVDVLPELSDLRAEYRAVGGRLVTFTTLRDPASHIISFYEMWPTLTCNGTRSCSRASFARFLPDAVGLQTRILAGPKVRLKFPIPAYRRETQHPNGMFPCNEAHTERALSTLRSFDVIGFTSNLSAATDQVESCTGLWMPRRVPHKSERHTAFVTEEERADPAIQAAIRAAAACDIQLHQMMLRHLGTGTCGAVGARAGLQ
uniref:Sulfotransferase domain-containing protein n=1 Tax=Coccolithus braarudii TaxID=221442 RepID=A0A7S0LV35_9EUKA|mmetsp:Transcript_7411/g.16240  ORF Transcript_7411/g.16240 Transcript_7411/m.16240 type:complete len:331 (+) Transcript_7411:101-1093(+)